MDGKHVFELPMTEIGDVQGTKEDAILEFHVDDGTISQKEDALCSITFVIPDDNEQFPGISSFPLLHGMKQAIKNHKYQLCHEVCSRGREECGRGLQGGHHG
jgi:hypothetical protein